MKELAYSVAYAGGWGFKPPPEQEKIVVENDVISEGSIFSSNFPQNIQGTVLQIFANSPASKGSAPAPPTRPAITLNPRKFSGYATEHIGCISAFIFLISSF